MASSDNPYLDSAEADSYFLGRLYTSKWDNATESNKDAALTMATRTIDRLAYIGRKVSPTQENEFPRVLPTTAVLSEVSTQSVVPDAILDACCEEALSLLIQDPQGKLDALRVSSEGIASIRTTYNDNDEPWVRAGFNSKIAFDLIGQFLLNTMSVKVVRT